MVSPLTFLLRDGLQRNFELVAIGALLAGLQSVEGAVGGLAELSRAGINQTLHLGLVVDPV